MRAVIFAFTESGKATALRIQEALNSDEVLLKTPMRLANGRFEAYSGGLSDCVGGVFDRDALIFVGAAGIAVRAIAPHVLSKRTDPAVLCLDEKGQYVIPLLSGHIGGANRLARKLAAAMNAAPVITTATDVNGRFSVDAWAAERGMTIGSMALAKRVSAEMLTQDIPIYSDRPEPTTLPDGLIWSDKGELGICVTVHDQAPFEHTLRLIPKALIVGIGCRRGIPSEAVETAIEVVFRDNGLLIEAVRKAASIDVKRNETGLNICCQKHGWPVTYYTVEQLRAVPGDFTPSAFVRDTVGVDNVCERAAAAGGGRIIVPKTALNGVTVAVAEMKWGIDFG